MGSAPAQVACPGGCTDEAYCSAACADAAWHAHHGLTCSGPAPAATAASMPAAEPRPLPDDTRCSSARPVPSGVAGAGPGGALRRGAGARQGGAADAEAMRGFRAHADATNDIFHVAAQVVAGTLLRARRALRDACLAASGAGARRPLPTLHDGLMVLGFRWGMASGSSCMSFLAAIAASWAPYAAGVCTHPVYSLTYFSPSFVSGTHSRT